MTDQTPTSNITGGRHAAPIPLEMAALLDPTERALVVSNTPRGRARVLNARRLLDGTYMVRVRVDDFYRHDFWLEMDIPLAEINEALERAGRV